MPGRACGQMAPCGKCSEHRVAVNHDEATGIYLCACCWLISGKEPAKLDRLVSFKAPFLKAPSLLQDGRRMSDIAVVVQAEVRRMSDSKPARPCSSPALQRSCSREVLAARAVNSAPSMPSWRSPQPGVANRRYAQPERISTSATRRASSFSAAAVVSLVKSRAASPSPSPRARRRAISSHRTAGKPRSTSQSIPDFNIWRTSTWLHHKPARKNLHGGV